MANNNETIMTWTFLSKAEPSEELLSLLCDGEVALQCYKTARDVACLTNKRLIIMDKQGITGKKTEIYSLPFRSIDMWSSENAGKLLDMNADLELWTKAGHFKLKVNSQCDIREFDRILSKEILG